MWYSQFFQHRLPSGPVSYPVIWEVTSTVCQVPMYMLGMFLGCSFVPVPYVFLLALVPHRFNFVALYIFYFLIRWIWSLLFSLKISRLLKVCYSFVPISIKFPLSSAGVILDLDQIYRLIWGRIKNFQVVPWPRIFLHLLRSFSRKVLCLCH